MMSQVSKLSVLMRACCACAGFLVVANDGAWAAVAPPSTAASAPKATGKPLAPKAAKTANAAEGYSVAPAPAG